MKFEVSIKQVENGFAVYYDSKIWVAKDITKLQLLIGDLYERHQEQNLKREQTR